ncbi:MAG TPA: SCO family protein [Gemmatimonadales bacterium]|jgi:protein SCO1/2
MVVPGWIPRGALAALCLSLVHGCGAPDPRPGELRGAHLTPPWPKPDFTLTDTDGDDFAFRKETSGSVTLLFFGFTNCPDVCPVQLANLAAVLHRQPGEIANRVRVVFVTTDPARDTPDRLRAWLDRFDPAFVGLAGPLDEVNRILRSVGLAPAVKVPTNDGGYAMGHAAQIIAYTEDERAHVMYPSGTRQEDWAHDLPRLVRGDWARIDQ